MDDVDVVSGLLTLRTDSFAEKLNDVSMEAEYENVEYLELDLSNEEVGNPVNLWSSNTDKQNYVAMEEDCVNVSYLRCDVDNEEPDNTRSSNRIIDPNMFLNVLKSLKHKNGCVGSVQSMELRKEVRSGLNLKYTVSCSACGSTSLKSKPVNSVSTNEASIVGAMAAGLGFIGHKKQFDAINVPTMCERSYRQKSHKVGKNVLTLSKESMKESAAMEKDLAIQAGSVSSDGTPLITVMLDGCFCKRSYGSNYSSLSGGACVIGLKTGLILDAEVLNRYCHICRINNKKVDHDCSYNYSGPASGNFFILFIHQRKKRN